MTTIDESVFDTPGRGRGLLDVFRYRYLLRVLIGKSTSLRYRNSVLGWFWSYVRPTIQFLVYYLVIGQILGMHRSVPAFPLYLFCGIVMVNLFNEAFGSATKSIVENKALVRKIYLPRELFPIANVVGAFIHFLPQLAVLIIVALLFGWIPSLLSISYMLIAVVLILVTVLGAGLFFSAFNVRFRDAQNIVEIIRTISTWSAPVLYTWVMVKSVAGEHMWLFDVFMSNPLTLSVELFHQAIWAQLPEISAIVTAGDAATVVPNALFPPGFGWYLLAGSGIAAVLLVIGQLVFRRIERTFAQDL